VHRSIPKAALVVAALAILSACASSRLYKQGLADFEQGHYEVALQKLSQAAEKDPGNLSYRIDYKGRRDEAVQKLVAEGDRARFGGDAAAAEAAYKRVLAIEQGSSRASHGLEGIAADRRHAQAVAQAQAEFGKGDLDQADGRLGAVLAEDPGYAPATTLRARIEAARGPMTVTPRLRTRDNRPVTLQFRDAPSKMVFEVLSRQTGINFIFDKDVKSDGKTTIFVQDVPIESAIDLVLGQNQLSRQVLSDNMVLIYPNTPAKQKDYQDEIVKTFYLNTALPKDVESLLKTVLDAKTLVVNERANTITIRDTPETVRMAEKLVASIDIAEPEVMLEVEVLEITRTSLQQLGISYPGSATISTPRNLVLNDFKGGVNSVINGDTLSVSPLSVTIDALKTNSNANVLASPRIRARNKEKAKVLIGSRVPVITTAASASGNGGIVSNTNVQYLDVGLTLEVEPTIYGDGDVAIKTNLEVSSITNKLNVPSGNGGTTIAYEIGTRNASTLLQLKDGETQILAGLIRDSDTHSASRIPGLGDIPLVGRLFADHNTDKSKTEVVLSITPRIIRAKPRPSSDTTEFWFGTQSRSGMQPLGARSNGMNATAGSPAPGVAAPALAPRAPGNVDSQGGGVMVGGPAAAAVMAPVPTGTPLVRVAPTGPVPHPTLTIDGPGSVKPGDEFDVTFNLQTDGALNRVRAQVRFDGATLSLVGAEPGELVPAELQSKVARMPAGAQLDVTASPEKPLIGAGNFMTLHFKALQARATTAIAAQLSVLGADGVPLASSVPAPLALAVGN
jgi:general secretion pathway protein D